MFNNSSSPIEEKTSKMKAILLITVVFAIFAFAFALPSANPNAAPQPQLQPQYWGSNYGYAMPYYGLGYGYYGW
ncbi:hypothetical protein FQA39_LY00429 [Lamprigera yunnana]|nr:hypothetical protein FQA39_LY00429 [Lamprigera yunnana]